MILLSRPGLPTDTVADLERRTRIIQAADDSKIASTKAWSNFRGSHRATVREALERMTTGLSRCMYCEDSAGSHIDHFEPKVRNPQRTFDWSNLLLACAHCNSNYKRDKYPVDGDRPLLLNPCVDNPLEHFGFSPSTGLLVANSVEAKWTLEVFALNRDVLVKGRKAAATTLKHIVPIYAKACENADRLVMEEITQAVSSYPFRAVFAFLALGGPSVSSAYLQHVAEHPELSAL